MKKNILTVENCNALSYVITSVLGKDYAVTNVENPVDAAECLYGNEKKDLIILDIDQDSDNLELLKHINSSSVLGKIPTVVISNSDDPSLKNRTVKLGASLFLTKPFDPVFLSSKVKDLIYANGEGPQRKRKTVFNLNIF
ncbi:MAG: response regulator [Flavobacterium sp.]|nr:MAG: response regulator [Flavobacterium sp.]